MIFWIDAQLSPHLAAWLTARFGSPPQVIWVTCGNTSTARIRQIFEILFPQALQLLQGGDSLVEITDIP